MDMGTDDWGHAEGPIRRAFGIVQELAERGPLIETEWGSCLLCNTKTLLPMEPHEHQPECPWRRARELFPTQ